MIIKEDKSEKNQNVVVVCNQEVYCIKFNQTVRSMCNELGTSLNLRVAKFKVEVENEEVREDFILEDGSAVYVEVEDCIKIEIIPGRIDCFYISEDVKLFGTSDGCLIKNGKTYLYEKDISIRCITYNVETDTICYTLFYDDMIYFSNFENVQGTRGIIHLKFLDDRLIYASYCEFVRYHFYKLGKLDKEYPIKIVSIETSKNYIITADMEDIITVRDPYSFDVLQSFQNYMRINKITISPSQNFFFVITTTNIATLYNLINNSKQFQLKQDYRAKILEFINDEVVCFLYYPRLLEIQNIHTKEVLFEYNVNCMCINDIKIISDRIYLICRAYNDNSNLIEIASLN